MKKFEYKATSGSQMMTSVELNDLGNDGWELVSHTSDNHNGYRDYSYVFKREKQ